MHAFWYEKPFSYKFYIALGERRALSKKVKNLVKHFQKINRGLAYKSYHRKYTLLETDRQKNNKFHM